jgi:PAS domain S-box-containing protein
MTRTTINDSPGNAGRWMNVGLAATLCIFAVIAVLTYSGIGSYLAHSAGITQSNILRNRLDRLVSSLKDVQRGARGYVITSDPRFLDPFRTGTGLIRGEIDSLQAMTSVDSSQASRLAQVRSFGEALMGITLKEVEFVNGGEPDSAREFVRSGEAKKAMDSIEDLVRQMDDEESRSLFDRQSAASAELKAFLFYLGMGSGLNFLLMIGIFVAMNRLSRKRYTLALNLQRSEQRMQTVINSIQEGITFSDERGNFEIFNRRMEELTGFTIEEANRSGDFSRLIYPNPEDRQKALDGLQIVIRRPGAHSSETTITSKSGAKRILRISSQMLGRLEQNMFLSTYEDITERKQVEAAVRHAEEKYRSIVENAVEGIYQSTLDGRFLTANPALVQMFGYASVEELIDAVTDVKHQCYVEPDHREEFIRLLREQEAVLGFESRVYRKDGSVIWVSENARAIFDTGGRLVGFEGTLVDITRRKKAEEMIRLDSEIMRHLSEGVYLVRKTDGVIVYANPEFEAMFGYEPDELIGKHVSVVNAPSEVSPREAAAAISDSLFKNGLWHGEVFTIKKDGTTFWCNASVSTFDHPDYGEVWIAIHSDITAHKQAQDEREKLIHELENALADVKTLSGLVPICASCKKIRDDSGFWTQLEAYIQNRTNAQFSHGICPDCARQLYPEVFRDEKTKTGRAGQKSTA